MGWGSKPALLLIDVCNAYWSEGSPLDTSSNPASAAAPASITKLVEAAREGNVPVVWTRVEYTEPDMSDAGVFAIKVPLLKVFQKGNETGLEDWLPGLAPCEGDIVVPKRYPSAFFATDLNTRLQLKGVDTLVVCGVSTSGCVRASTLDAMCLGYRPMVRYEREMRALDCADSVRSGGSRGVRRPLARDPRCQHVRHERKDGRRGPRRRGHSKVEGGVVVRARQYQTKLTKFNKVHASRLGHDNTVHVSLPSKHKMQNSSTSALSPPRTRPRSLYAPARPWHSSPASFQGPWAESAPSAS
jgi:nicotinamidase-related amidase